MFRLALALLFAATAAPLAAFFAQPAGYAMTEYPQTAGTGGPAWDQASGASDFYAHHNGGIRRFATAGAAYAGTLMFPAPSGEFFDAMAIDPASPDDFYVSYSSFTNSTLHKLGRTGADSSVTVASASYAAPDFFIYRLCFVPDLPGVPVALRGQLLAAALPSSTFVAGIYLIDKTTLAMSLLIDLATTNGNGPFGVDASGNVYATIPPTFGSFTGAVLLRFDAASVAAAVGGTPVGVGAGSALIAASEQEWNVTALTVREEAGGTFVYYSTFEHASVKRMCVQTGQTRQFIQGFGGVSDGYQHFAQGGTLAFSSAADDFAPQAGGAVRLLIPFSVFTPGFGSYHSVFLFDPEAVNATIASLAITQQPAAINSGVPFAISLQALDATSTPVNGNAGVLVTGSAGVLDGFTVTCQPGGSVILDGLVLTLGALPGSISFTIELTGNSAINATTGAIAVVAPATAVALVSQPATAESGTFFDVGIELRDSSGARVQSGPDAAREVNISVLSGPGSLWGDTLTLASAGAATFSPLIVDAPGAYVLECASPGLTPITFNLTVATPGSGNDSSDNAGSGCSTTGRSSMAVWPAALALLALATRLRRRVARQ